jgi:hypothetical protein
LRCVTVPAPLFPDKIGTRDFAHEQNTKAQEGAATGAGTGAVLGGAFRWLVGIGARNPRARTLHCRRGLTGAQIGMGIPEYEAKDEGKVKEVEVS